MTNKDSRLLIHNHLSALIGSGMTSPALLSGADLIIDLPEECGRVKRRKLLSVKKQSENKKILFVRTGINCVPYRELNGNHFWLVTLLVFEEDQSPARFREEKSQVEPS